MKNSLTNYSQLLQSPHPLDCLGAGAAADVRRLAELFGFDAVNASAPVGTSKLSLQQAQRFWSEHRERLFQLLQQPAQQPSRSASLCLVGAGNCLDLDIPALFDSGFSRIMLLDLDRRAIYSVLERFERSRAGECYGEMQEDGTLRLVMRADPAVWLAAKPLDASLMLQGLEQHAPDYVSRMLVLAQRGVEPREVFGRLSDWLEQAVCVDPWLEEQAGYDVVLSDCLLSQMVSAAASKVLVRLQDVVRQCQSSQSVEAFVHVVLALCEQHVFHHHLRLLRMLGGREGVVCVAADTIALERRKIRGGQNIPEGHRLVHDDGNAMLVEQRKPRFLSGRSLLECLRKQFPRQAQIEIRDQGQWFWNRQPIELQETAPSWKDARVFFAEQVQAVSFAGVDPAPPKSW